MHSLLADDERTGMDHRYGTRRPLTLPVRLESHGSPTAFGRVLEVSLSGAYIETALPFAPFTRVSLVCGRALYERIGASRITAFVSRVTAGGVAVEWLEFAAPAIRRMVALAGPA